MKIMKIIDYWTTDRELVAIDDISTMHFIELQKMKDYLDRNNFLDWHWSVSDDQGTTGHNEKLTFEQWLQEPERCKRDIICYLETQHILNTILNPINNILKNFKNDKDKE